jgi:hypothetical protein
MYHLHTIPVDDTLTPEEAWAELVEYGSRLTDTGHETWAVLWCSGCRSVPVGAHVIHRKDGGQHPVGEGGLITWWCRCGQTAVRAPTLISRLASPCCYSLGWRSWPGRPSQ